MSKFTRKEVDRPLSEMSESQLTRGIRRWLDAGQSDQERDEGVLKQLAEFEQQDQSNG